MVASEEDAAGSGDPVKLVSLWSANIEWLANLVYSLKHRRQMPRRRPVFCRFAKPSRRRRTL